MFTSWGVDVHWGQSVNRERASNDHTAAALCHSSMGRKERRTTAFTHVITSRYLILAGLTSHYISYSTAKWLPRQGEAISVAEFRFRRWHHSTRLTFFVRWNMFLFVVKKALCCVCWGGGETPLWQACSFFLTVTSYDSGEREKLPVC